MKENFVKSHQVGTPSTHQTLQLQKGLAITGCWFESYQANPWFYNVHMYRASIVIYSFTESQLCEKGWQLPALCLFPLVGVCQVPLTGRSSKTGSNSIQPKYCILIVRSVYSQRCLYINSTPAISKDCAFLINVCSRPIWGTHEYSF